MSHRILYLSLGIIFSWITVCSSANLQSTTDSAVFKSDYKHILKETNTSTQAQNTETIKAERRNNKRTVQKNPNYGKVLLMKKDSVENE